MDDGIDFPGYDKKPVVQRLPVHAFAAGAWREVQPKEEATQRAALTFATFNTWFQGDAPELRYRGLLRILEKVNADVIVLQETTVYLLERLMESDWVRSAYRFARAPFRADAIPSHGVMLLSRLPFWNATLHPLPTSMGRALLTVEARINGGKFVFATAHFESMKSHADTRGEQLRAAFAILEPANDAMLAGDFNFCSSWPAENARLDRRYADVWAALRPGDAGYTQNTDVNLMLADAKGETKKVRFDRILLRSDARRWTPRSIELLGTAPVEPKFPRVFPSDHFGLAAVFGAAG